MTTARLKQELARLRQRTRPARPLRSERESFEDFQAREIPRRNRELPSSVKLARSRIGWLRMVGDLLGFASAEQLIEDVSEAPDGSGSRLPPQERSRVLIEREVYASIWRGDPGLQHLSVPPEWAEVLDASETWRARLQSVPPATFARWLVEARRVMQDGSADAQIEALAGRHLREYRIDEPLLERVVGQGVLDLSSEELRWMLNASLQDLFVSQWAFEVGEEIRKLDEREGGN
jgi:hypothetical protein